ncbi:hypothetical protein SCUCBS95973_007457 [Sporothrix curviconia]|uniref:Cytochrome p450 protein n=1 Tax=Sporothrix curviconia TaxID=1260050 RepID=A0ABP0CDF5_9PEZI
MRSTALVGLFVTSAAASPSGIHDRTGRVVHKRTTETAQLYAYGTNISGLAIYAGSDNLAYLATAGAAANLTAVTWTIDTSGTDAWTVAANATAATANSTNSTSALTSGSAFYIVSDSASADAFAQAGFVSDAASAPTGATTTGFVTYGPYVMVLEDDADGSGQETYVSEFWATTTDTDGLWTLMWNEAGTAQDNSVPLTIKTTAPVVSELL